MTTKTLPDWLKWMVPFAVPIAAAIAAAWLLTHLNARDIAYQGQEIERIENKIDLEMKRHERMPAHGSVEKRLRDLHWENVLQNSRIRALEKQLGETP